MTITATSRGTGTHNTGAASFGFSPATNPTAGAKLVLCVTADNSSSGGATNDFTTVTDTAGNTWIKRQSPVFDNGAASAGVQGAIFDCDQSVATLTTASTITVSFGSSPVAKAWTLTELTSSVGRVAYRTSGDKAAGATATALTTGASASVTVGECIIAAMFMEAGTTQSITAEDTDGTNGAWATSSYAEIGTTTAGAVIASSTKVQTTANSTQSYDITVGVSSDYTASWAIYYEASFAGRGDGGWW